MKIRQMCPKNSFLFFLESISFFTSSSESSLTNIQRGLQKIKKKNQELALGCERPHIIKMESL